MFKVLVIGPPKTGTTLLYELLKDDSSGLSFPIPPIKETHYFNSTSEWDLTEYRAFFYPTNKELSEVAPSYFRLSGLYNFIKPVSPNLKIVIGIRNPQALFESYLNHLIKKGEVKRDAILNENLIDRILDDISYCRNLVKWPVDKNVTLFYKFEDLIENQNDGFLRVCDFLGIKALRDVNNRVVNEGFTNRNIPLQKARRIAYSFLRERKLFFLIRVLSKLSSKFWISEKLPKRSLTTQELSRLAPVFRSENEMILKFTGIRYE